MPETSQHDWNIDSLLEALRPQYLSHASESYWESERPCVERRLIALQHHLSARYINPFIQGVGGSGIVLGVTDSELVDQLCAIKFPRPVPGKGDLLVAMMEKEISRLARLRHGSVVRIHGSNKIVELEDEETKLIFPYYIMDFVAGSGSSKYLAANAVDERAFIQIIQATVDALRYLHANSVAHLDIKPDNILIGSNGIPVIADLGTAKAILDSTQDTIVACTFGYADPDLVEMLEEDPTDENRAKGKIPRKTIDLRWDLYSLGKTILNWLGFELNGKEQSRKHKLSPYSRKYLLLLAARMLRGRVDQWLEDRVGLDRRLLKELAYADADRVLQDVRKLSGEYSIVDFVPELNAYKPATLQVGTGPPATYSKRLGDLLDHSALRRLGTIRQLGLVAQVYPTATHSRLEHSLGAYQNTCRFVLSLYYDPLSPLFRQMVDADDVCALLVSALLHDVGHFPLAHDLEEIDSSLFGHKPLGAAIIRGVRDTKRPGARRISLTAFDDVLASWVLRRSA
jgi:serine/threonine protein kinase